MPAGLCIWSAVNKYQNVKAKVAKKAFNMGRSGIQYVAMITELLRSYWRGHLAESYCKVSNISDTNWLRYLFFIIFEHNLVECMTSSLVSFAYFKNLNISGTKRDIWKQQTAFFCSWSQLIYVLKWLRKERCDFVIVPL